MSKSCPHFDRILGGNEEISRRDFLDGALLASGSILLGSVSPAQVLAQASDWTGYTGEGDYRTSAGNMEEVVRAAHAVRDGQYDKAVHVIDTGETFDCVMVGGGFSGLSAALFSPNEPGRDAPAWCSTMLPSLVALPSATSLSLTATAFTRRRPPYISSPLSP
jgi:hypothetical protein